MLNPGPELDALVAEKVMGWVKLTDCKASRDDGAYEEVDKDLLHRDSYYVHPSGELISTVLGDGFPPYSTSISAAWQVVENMRATSGRKPYYQLLLRDSGEIGYTEPEGIPLVKRVFWTVCFVGPYVDVLKCEAKSESAPHAICLAALKAIGYSESGG